MKKLNLREAVSSGQEKLKEKTQPQGGSYLRTRKTQGKNLNFKNFLKKLNGLTFYAIFIIKYFQKLYILNENWNFAPSFRKFEKNQEKNL